MSGAIRTPASPISSASTPPGPSAMSGPNSGSWTSPASSSALPRRIGWTMHRASDPRGGLAHGVLVGRSSTTPPVSVLWAPGDRGLHDGREAELRGGRAASSGVVRDALLDDRDSVGLEQRAGLVGVEPEVGRALERGGDDAARRARSMPSSAGTPPAGRRSHSARAAARPRARAADSG